MNKMLNDAELEAAVALKTKDEEAVRHEARLVAERAETERVQRADQQFHSYHCDCTPMNRFGYPIRASANRIAG